MSTIAAISTAHGDAAIGVIRLSGPDAHKIAGAVFSPMPKKPRQAAVGVLSDGEGPVDKAVLTLWKAPRSYTGEDMAEFSCHGGRVVLRQALAAVVAAGARPAGPGEFTKRAFVNGKLDLAESEGVIELIMATSAAAARAAFSQSAGALSGEIRAIRQGLVEVDADIMAYVDFSSEGIEPPEPGGLLTRLRGAAGRLRKLLDTERRGRIVAEGAPCAIIGRPNAGKSSVMNLLSGRERSIVTDLPGTTRDVVEQPCELGGLLLRLMDTAGMRETADLVEAIGVERAKSAAAEAGLTLAVFDMSRPLTEEDMAVAALCRNREAVALLNKCDLPAAADSAELTPYFKKLQRFSAKTGEGLGELSAYIGGLYLPEEGEVLMTSLRHAEAAGRALARVEAAVSALMDGELCDMAEFDIRAATRALGEVTGEDVADDVVDSIFSRFCVGK
ncbi:MAG TPA: tRNA uridine-5-carboxymethylaminomethyl(34) synthesis GTPase MnmE [Terriglobales bacterium]|nr:tRNA uridine-5-carboxymethylaminomethyl(34) synthesis GTPase MnmE [Terriglobales bacterium]